MSDAPKPPPEAPAAPPGEPVRLSRTEAKLRAAMEAPGFREALQRLEEIESEPDPAAPDPVVVLPDKGGEVLITDTEAAAAYVEPTAPQTGRVPHHTLTRIQVDARLDPRKQVTQRTIRSAIVPPAQAVAPRDEAGAAAGEPAPAPLPAVDPEAPSARAPRAPSSRPPPPSSTSTPAIRSRAGAHRPAAWWIPLLGGCAGAIAIVLALRPDKLPAGGNDVVSAGGAPVATTAALPGTRGTGASMVESVATTGTPAVPSAPVATSAATVTDTAPAPAATSAAPATTTSVKPAPKSTDDPYVDAGALPSKSTPPAIPSATPSAVRSSAPSTTAAGPPPPYEEP